MTAPDVATRRTSDLCRRRLYRVTGPTSEEICFIEDNIPDVVERLDAIISSFDAADPEDTIAYSVHLLRLYLQKRPISFSKKLRDGFERDLVNAIWIVMRSSSMEDRIQVGFSASMILE